MRTGKVRVDKASPVGYQMVIVSMDGVVAGFTPNQLWIAAVPREEAVAAVQKRIPAFWRAALSDQRLPPKLVGLLQLRPGEVRQLKSTL